MPVFKRRVLETLCKNGVGGAVVRIESADEERLCLEEGVAKSTLKSVLFF